MTWSTSPHNLSDTCCNKACDWLTVYWVDQEGKKWPTKHFPRDKWAQAQAWIDEHTQPEKGEGPND